MFACGHIIYFRDGGEPEECILGRGTLEECQKIGEVVLAVSYSGDRPIDHAEFVIREMQDPMT